MGVGNFETLDCDLHAIPLPDRVERIPNLTLDVSNAAWHFILTLHPEISRSLSADLAARIPCEL